MEPRNLPPLATRRQVAMTVVPGWVSKNCLILGMARPGLEIKSNLNSRKGLSRSMAAALSTSSEGSVAVIATQVRGRRRGRRRGTKLLAAEIISRFGANLTGAELQMQQGFATCRKN